jgi:sugar phosphate isomerase/epimerase
VTRRQAYRLFHEGLDQVLPLAQELGVKVLIEPEPGLLMENSRQIRTFISHLHCDAAGVNFDIGHFYCAGENPAAAFENLRAWVGHVHIEDIAPSRVHNHLIPGLGAIDFAAVLAAMKRLGYQGHISLELYPYVDAPEDAGRRGLAHLKPILEQVGMGI